MTLTSIVKPETAGRVGVLTVLSVLLCSCAASKRVPAPVYVGPDPNSQPVAAPPEISPPAAAEPNHPASPPEPLRITIQDAVVLAMENNRALRVERLNPRVNETYEQEAQAEFDAQIVADVSNRRVVTERLSRAGTSTEGSIVDSMSGSIGWSKLLPTGTTLALDATTNYTDSSLYSDVYLANRLGLSVTQALLRGLDIRANRARIRQARLDTLISQYELRGFAETLLEQVESKFWDYALAQRQIEIYTNSLNLAEKQMTETRERVALGDLAETEMAAAQAEVALQRENLINARSTLAQERLQLLRLLSPSGHVDWTRDIILDYNTAPPDEHLAEVEQHVQVALRMRPDLNQARLQIRRGDLEVVRTKNGLLPRLDMFVEFGKTGYADTFNRAVNHLNDDLYDVTWGLAGNLSPANRAARARYTRALIGRRQQRQALENLLQLVHVDVRSAYVEVTSARERIAATAATRSLQEEKLRAETEKFRVGRSTTLLVGQAQRDVVESQIAEIQAMADYLKALVSLYRLEGSLLNRRGIAAPGAEPVVLEPGRVK